MAKLSPEVIAFYVSAIDNVLLNLRRHIDEQFEGEKSSVDIEAFTEFVREFCDRGRSFLRDKRETAFNPAISDEEIEILQSDLIKFFQKGVCKIHSLVKDISDVNVLEVPAAFFILAKRLTQNLVDKAHVIIKRSSQINYSSDPVLIDFSTPLGFAYPTPDIAVLDFPFSEGRNVLQNCLIFHEVGHFVWFARYTSFSGKLWGNVDQSELSTLMKSVMDHVNNLVPPSSNPSKKQVELMEMGAYWMSEVFADLIATAMIGPAFLSAFVTQLFFEIVSPVGSIAFDRAHPPTRWRLKIILDFLKDTRNDWTRILHDDFPWLLKISEEWMTSYPADYADEDLRIPAEFLRVTEQSLKNLIFDLCSPHKAICLASEYGDYHSLILHYLASDVIPSQLVDTYKKDVVVPKPSHILIAAFAHYFKISGITTMNHDDSNGKVYQRLNQWVLKSIEDIMVLEKLPKLNLS